MAGRCFAASSFGAGAHLNCKEGSGAFLTTGESAAFYRSLVVLRLLTRGGAGEWLHVSIFEFELPRRQVAGTLAHRLATVGAAAAQGNGSVLVMCGAVSCLDNIHDHAYPEVLEVVPSRGACDARWPGKGGGGFDMAVYRRHA